MLDPVGEEDPVEVVELMLDGAGAEPSEPLRVLVALGVELTHVDLGEARQDAAKVGDAEGSLVGPVDLVGQRRHDRIDEHTAR